MPHRLSRAERRQRTREELVDPAIRLFAEEGVARTPVEAVAAPAALQGLFDGTNLGKRGRPVLDTSTATLDTAPHWRRVGARLGRHRARPDPGPDRRRKA